MTKKKKSEKEIIKCPFCDKDLIKKYISQHIRRIHKENEYCNIIKRGMTYKNLPQKIKKNTNNNLFICQFCNKSINKKSKYNHFSSKSHKYWSDKIIPKNLQNENKSKKGQNNFKTSSINEVCKNFNSEIDARYFRTPLGLIPKCFIENNINYNFENKTEHIFDELENKKDDNFSYFEDSDSSSSSGLFNSSQVSRESIFDSCYDSWKIRKEVDRVIENIENKKKKQKIK